MSLFRRNLAIGHGLFLVAFGLWPVLSISTFEKITGPKQDDWLVKTVGLLLATSGSVILSSGWQSRRVPKEISSLAKRQALVLAAISAHYSVRGRISKIYLLDSLVEGVLFGMWRAANDRPLH